MKTWMLKSSLCLFLVLAACDNKKDSENTDNNSSGNNENLPQAESSSWDTGTTVPPQEAGKEGDFFIHTGTGELYRKLRDQWTVVMNMRGAAGAPGAPGAAGPQGPKGEPGLNGAVGAQGPAGPQGPAGLNGAAGPQGPKGDTGATGAMGAQGPAGAQGLAGEHGLDANRIILAHRFGQTATIWKVPKRVIAGGPSTLEVTYGTVGNGAVILDLGPRVRCAYRGEGASADPRYGTFDYERGRIASLEKCVDQGVVSPSDILNRTDRYTKAAAIDMARGLELISQDQVSFQILKAGTTVPGAKVLALIPLYVYP